MPPPAAAAAAARPTAPSPWWLSPWVLAASAVVLAALPLLWLHGGAPERQRERLAWLLYAGPCATLLFAAATAVWRLRVRTVGVGERLRTWWPGALLALVATALVVTAVPGRQRVQFDETSLLGTSQNMHEQRLAVMTTASLPSRGEHVPIASMVDKRPTLFACLTSLVHDVRGYAVGNVFFVNVALLALALFTAFAALRARAGPLLALAAPLLLLAVPLTTIVASSGGFELLATLLFGWVLLAAHDVVLAPSPRHVPPRLANLAGVGALFAWSRYESLPALLLVLALVAWQLRGRWPNSVGVHVALALLPALLVPLLPLLLYARDPRFYPEAGGAPLLAFAHGVAHTGPFLAAWFWPLLGQPLPGLLAWLAVAVLGGLGVQRWRSRGRGSRAHEPTNAHASTDAHRHASEGQREPERRHGTTALACLWLLPILAVTTLVLFWFYGDVHEPTALRLFLPAAWATALLPLVVVARGCEPHPGGSRLGRNTALALLVATAGLAVWQVRAVARDDAFPALADAQMLDTLDGVAQRLGGDRGHTLWVGMPAQFLITRGHAAVSPQTFLDRAADVRALLRQGDVRTIYVVETPRDEALAPAFGRPRDVLYQLPGEVVERIGGRQPLTVYRLRP